MIFSDEDQNFETWSLRKVTCYWEAIIADFDHHLKEKSVEKNSPLS